MTKVTTDDKPIHDIIHGRWLCSDLGMAYDCARDHPGSYVYTYERDKDGIMFNIVLVHDPHSQIPKTPIVKGGRIRGILPSEFEEK